MLKDILFLVRVSIGTTDSAFSRSIDHGRINDIKVLGTIGECAMDHHISQAILIGNQELLDAIMKCRCNKEISQQLNDHADVNDMKL
jgi:hypothetical protein